MRAQDVADRNSLLRTALDGLVPLYMFRFRTTSALSVERAQACADVITAHGDDLDLSRDGKEPGSALNAMAEGIAIMALARPEGVDLLGGHWCRNHSECGVTE